MSELDKVIDQIESHAALAREQKLRAEIERLRAEREAADKNAVEAWAQRDAYMESNTKLLAEIERLQRLLKDAK